MQVVDICRALYKISTGTPASRGPSATAGLLVSFWFCMVLSWHSSAFERTLKHSYHPFIHSQQPVGKGVRVSHVALAAIMSRVDTGYTAAAAAAVAATKCAQQ